MSYQKILSFFAAPVFPHDAAKTRRAYLLNLTLLVIILLTSILMVGNSLDARMPTATITVNLIGIFCYVGLWFMMRTGRITLTSILLILFGAAVVTAVILSLGTIRVPAASFYVLLIVAASLLLDLPSIILTVILCSLLILGLIAAENFGWLPAPDYAVTFSQWLTYSTAFVLTGFLGFIGLRSILRALAHADEELAARKKLEHELQTQRDFAVSVMNSVGQGLSVTNQERKIEYINPAYARMLGYTPEELVGRLARELYYPPDLAKLEAMHAERQAGHSSTYEIRLVRRDGTPVEVEITAVPRWDGDRVIGSIGVATDLTERKRTEAILRASEERYRMLLENIPIPVYTKDVDGVYTSTNPANLRDWAVNPVGHTDAELLDPKYAEALRAIDQLVMAGIGIQEVEEQLPTVNGLRTMLSSKVPLKDSEGNVVGILGASLDVTTRKQLEEAQRANAMLYRQMFAEHSAIMLLIDPDSGAIVDANTAAENFYGHAHTALLKMKIQSINTMPSAEVTHRLAEIQNSRENYFIAQHRLVTGEVRDVEVYAVPIQNQNRTVLYAIIHDITARRQVETQLRFLSTHDALTGLYNRAFFESELTRLTPGREYPISIVIVDLDNMKATNDTLGHLEGDRLLKRAADIFRTAFRASDIVARIGGDEFAILLPETDMLTAERIVARIHLLVTQQNARRQGATLVLSCGMATAYKGPLSGTFHLADERMYEEKRAHKRGLDDA